MWVKCWIMITYLWKWKNTSVNVAITMWSPNVGYMLVMDWDKYWLWRNLSEGGKLCSGIFRRGNKDPIKYQNSKTQKPEKYQIAYFDIKGEASTPLPPPPRPLLWSPKYWMLLMQFTFHYLSITTCVLIMFYLIFGMANLS